MPTREEAWNQLWQESSAANEELCAAFAQVLKTERAEKVPDEDRQRYTAALRRFGAIDSKLRTLTNKLRRPKL